MLLKTFITETLVGVDIGSKEQLALYFDIGVIPVSYQGVNEIHVDDKSLNRIKFSVYIAAKVESE
jgi:hypothetical protein